MMNSGTYHMKGTIIKDGAETPVEVYMKDNMIAAAMGSGGADTMRMILRDNKTYIISDASKSVMAIPSGPQSSPTDIGLLDPAGMSHSGTGKDTFNGKSLPYDEYSLDEAGKMQFFMDGDKLAGVRTSGKALSADIIVETFDQNVPDDAFAIPDGYKRSGF